MGEKKNPKKTEILLRDYVLHINEFEDGSLHVYVHYRVGDQIHTPLGYLLGSNALQMGGKQHPKFKKGT